MKVSRRDPYAGPACSLRAMADKGKNRESVKKIRNSIVLQGTILAAAGLISKIIGFLYRIPMANMLGNEGNGLYSVAYGIYNIALTLSSYSIPLAVSKLMSARLAAKKTADAYAMFRLATLFAIITGIIADLCLRFGAEFLAGLYKKPGLEYPLRILAPTCFVVALLGTYRGFFQAHHDMIPTAISQVAEQIVNAAVSIGAAYMFIRLARVDRAYFPSEAAAGAAGGTAGTLAGASVAAILFVLFFGFINKYVKEEKESGMGRTEKTGDMIKVLLLTVYPVILSQSVYQLGYTMDDLIFGNVMTYARHFPEKEITILQGIFNTQYNQMINLPAAVSVAFASAALPSVSASFAKGNLEEVKAKAEKVLRFNLLVAIPSAAGLAVLSYPIMAVLFPALGSYRGEAVLMLLTGSTAVIFYTLSTLSASMLQACDRMWRPVINSLISLAMHVILLIVLLTYTGMTSMALVIGNITFPLITSLLNIRSLTKFTGFKPDWNRIFFRPFGASLIMAVSGFALRMVMRHDRSIRGLIYAPKEREGDIFELVATFIFSVAVYAVIVVAMRIVDTDDLAAMPLIGKYFRKKKKGQE